MRALLIVLFCVASAVVYGVFHDQVTARVCVEYFTIGHPPVFGTESPTLLGIGWGIIATWWVGLLLGVPLAFAARAGSRPKRDVGSLVKPIGVLLAIMAVSAAVLGFLGFLLGNAGAVHLLEPLASRVPRETHSRFLADLWAHSASYFVGFVGGLMVIVEVWRSRGRAS